MPGTQVTGGAVAAVSLAIEEFIAEKGEEGGSPIEGVTAGEDQAPNSQVTLLEAPEFWAMGPS